VSAQLGRRLRPESGFTLIELLVSMTVLLVFMAMFATAVSTTLRHSHDEVGQTLLQTQARAAVDALAQDIREASSGVSGTCPFEAATSTSLQFLAPDRSATALERRVAVQLSGGQLSRAMTISSNTTPPWSGFAWTTPPAGAWSSQVTNITNAAPFTYYDATGAPLSSPVTLSAINAVAITVAVRATGAPSATTYTTRATLRVSPDC
jgi:prepilin-type N-terminal cleavage/methylation domain-containing protein